jgi:hypothetical protein
MDNERLLKVLLDDYFTKRSLVERWAEAHQTHPYVAPENHIEDQQKAEKAILEFFKSRQL